MRRMWTPQLQQHAQHSLPGARRQALRAAICSLRCVAGNAPGWLAGVRKLATIHRAVRCDCWHRVPSLVDVNFLTLVPSLYV